MQPDTFHFPNDICEMAFTFLRAGPFVVCATLVVLATLAEENSHKSSGEGRQHSFAECNDICRIIAKKYFCKSARIECAGRSSVVYVVVY